MNYSNTTTYKTVLISRQKPITAALYVEAIVGLWRSTSAINRVFIFSNLAASEFAVGSTAPSMEYWRHKMATYTLIESQVLGSTTASVTFSAIDQTFTDLVLKYSPRGSAAYAASNLIMKFNGSTSGYSDRLLYTNNGTSALSYQQSAQANLIYSI
jgi:hypothetical protein